MIKAVTFDLWNTLIHDTRKNGETRTKQRLSKITDILESAKLPIDPEALNIGYFKCLDHCVKLRSAGLDLSFSEQIRTFLELSRDGVYETLPQSAIKDIESVYADVYLDYPSAIYPESLDIIKNLKFHGIKLAIISNTSMTPGTTFRKFLYKHGLAQYFDALIFSDELQVSKPNPYLFHYTLSKLGESEHQAVHVGDQYQTDIKGAIAAGMHNILIDPNPKADSWDVGSPSQIHPNLHELGIHLESILQSY